MHRRSAVGTTALLLLTVTGAITLTTPALQGQSGNHGTFDYLHAIDRARQAQNGLPEGSATQAQVLLGRVLVTGSGCASCHNSGKTDPNDPKWLANYETFQIGPFKTYAANLTPDAATGIGMHTDRQIFNALRFGLNPEVTPDVVITSNVPGQGNFPASPHYLAPPMPWPSFRHLPDADLWAIVAYLKHGVKPVNNAVPDSEGPPDNWASSYTADKIGPYPLPPYPAGNEQYSP